MMTELQANCSLCSLACPLVVRGGARGPIFSKDSLLELDWDRVEGSKYGGSLCARGNAVIEFVSHPGRLNYPFILGERSTIDAAVKETARNLADVKKEHGADAICMLLGENLTNEEAALAAQFAAEALGTDTFALFAPDDAPLFRAHTGCDLSAIAPAGSKPSGERQVTLVIGDAFAEHPCTAKIVLPAKYGTRGSECIVLSPERNHTAWFANRHLRCRPGGEAAVAVGLVKAAAEASQAKLPAEMKGLVEKLEWNAIEGIGGVARDAIAGAAKSMLGAAKVRTYISNIFGRIGEPTLTALFAEALTRLCPGEREFTPLFVQQNTWGIHSALAGRGSAATLDKLARNEIRALMILGFDLFSAYPAAPLEKALREKKFTVSTQLFWGQTAARSNVVVPAAGLMEKRGTVFPGIGEKIVRHETISPPGGTVSDGEFLIALAREMGVELKAGASPGEARRGSGACDGIGDDWAAYRDAMALLDAAEAVLIPWSEPVHVADGALSRNFHWSEITCPEPLLMISRELAAEGEIEDGDRLTVSSEGGETVLAATTTGKLTGTTVGATIHFPSVRRLFPWKYDPRRGELILAPVAVTLAKAGGKGG